MSWIGERAARWALACALVGAAAALAITLATSWREALLALAAGGAVATTRVRFAAAFATLVVALAAVLIATRVP
ncbi:MAG TPA: hypothetical protein VGG40_05395 [Solirubrobacterales bacterium]